MSSSIDERIVEMQFDNKQFEEGVKETSQTLDNFKKKLNLEGAAKGFEEIERSSNKVKLSGISAAVDEINKKFSLLGVAAATAVQNMTNKVVNSLSGMINSVTLGPINQGFGKYEEKLKATQVIMNATEMSVSEVNEQLDKLLTFTDETSYSFTDMVNNIGKFTANKVPLERSVQAMEGISTWAASAGANVQEAGRAMYNLSQAISVGSVKLMDWKSIENANMATAKFKEQVIETAVSVGQLTKVSKDLYKTNAGNEVSVTNFNEALKDEWFTSEVLLKTLDKYGKFSDRLIQSMSDLNDEFTASNMLKMIDQFKEGTLDLDKQADRAGVSVEKLSSIMKELSSDEYKVGREAFKAAQEARTFSDAIAATVDAVSSKWMQMFEYLFGNYEQAKKLWTDLSENMWTVFAGPLDNFNVVLDEWSKETEGQKDFLRGVYALGSALFNIIMNVREAFSSIFPPVTAQILATISKKFADFAEKIQKATEYGGEFVKKVIDNIAEPVKEANEVFEEITETVALTTEELNKFASAVIRGDYGNGEDRVKALKNIGLSYEGIQNEVNRLLGCEKRYLDEQGNVIQATKTVTKMNKKATESVEKLSEATDSVDTDKPSKELAKLAFNFDSSIPLGQKLHETLVGIFSAVNIFTQAMHALNTKIIAPLIGWALPRILNLVLSVTAGFGNWIKSLRDFITENQVFDKTLDTVINFFTTVKDGIKDFIDNIANLDSVKKTMELFTNFFDYLSKLKDGVFSGVSNVLAQLGQFGEKNTFVNVLTKAFDWLIDKINSFIIFIQPVTNYIGKLFNSLVAGLNTINVSSILDNIKARFAGVYEMVKDLFEYFKKNSWYIKDAFNKLLPDGLFKSLSQLQMNKYVTKFPEIQKIFTTLFKTFANGISNTTLLGEKLKGLSDSFSKITGSLSNFFKPITGFVKPATDSIKNFFARFYEGLKKVDLETVIGYLKSGVAIAAIGAFALALYKLSKVFGGLTGIFESVSGFFDSLKKSAKVTMILTVAGAIAILAGSLYLIAKIEPDRLVAAGIALGTIAVGLTAMMAVMGSIAKSGAGDDFMMVAFGMVAIAGAVMVLAGALSLLSDIDVSVESILLLGGIMSALLVVTWIMGKMNKGVMTTGASMRVVANMFGIYLFALSVVKIVEALDQLTKMDLASLEGKLRPLITIMGVLAIVAFAAGQVSFGGGFSLLATVAAIWLFVKLLERFEKVNFTKLNRTLGKMTGIFVALIALAVIGRLAGTATKGLGTMFLGMGLSLVLIAAAVKIMASIPEESIDKATNAMLKLILGMAAVALAARAFGGKHSVQLAAVFLALAVALTIISGIVYLFSQMDPNGLARGILAMMLLISAITIFTAVAGLASKAAVPLFALTALIGVLALAVWSLSQIPDPNAVLPICQGLGLVLFTMTLLLLPISKINGADIIVATVTLGLMAVLLYAIGEILKGLATSIPNPEGVLPIAAGLVLALAGISIVAKVAQGIDPVAVSKGAFGIASFVGIISAFALVSAALVGWINSAGAGYIENGLNILVIIGTKIGEFIGGFLGGLTGRFESAKATALANGLSKFMDGLTPFLEYVEDLDGEIITKIGLVKELMDTITSIDFSSLVGNENVAIMTEAMTNLATGIKTFNDEIQSVDNWDSFPMVVDAVATLAGIKLPNSGGFLADIMGDNTWGNFGEGLAQFGTQLVLFGSSVSMLSEESLEKIKLAAQAIQLLGDLKLPNSGGLLADLVGDNTWGDFGNGLVDFGRTLVKFADSVKDLDESRLSAIQVAVKTSKSLAELMDAIPNSGGLLAEFLGDNTWATMGDGLVEFGLVLGRFGSAVKTLDEEKVAAIDVAVNAATKLSELMTAMPNSGGIIAEWFGDNTWETFGQGLEEYGKALFTFGTNVQGLDLTTISTAVEASNLLTAFAAGLIDTSLLASFGENLSILGDNYVKFIASLSSSENSGGIISQFTSGLSTAFDNLESTTNVRLSSLLGTMSDKGVEFNARGQTLGEQLGAGFSISLGNLSSTITTQLDSVLLALASYNDGFNKKGSESGTSYKTGLESVDTKSAGESIANKAYNGANTSSSWYNLGMYAGMGFVNGLNSQLTNASNAGRSIADAAYNAAKKALDEHSPSRKMREVGSFGGEGFVNGLIAWISAAADASTELGNSAFDALSDTLSSSISDISDEMNNDMVITPVLDLSNLAYDANSINGMLNDMYIGTNLRGIKPTYNRFSSNDDLIASLNEKFNSVLDKLNTEENKQYTFETHVDLNGREIAKGTATYMSDEISKIERNNMRREGKR